MSTEEQAADLLEVVADGFQSGRYGWIKGRSNIIKADGSAAYCSTGALAHTALSAKRTGAIGPAVIFDLAVDALKEKIGTYVEAWNDGLPDNGGMDMVVETMKQTAKELRNRAEVTS